MCVRVFVWGRVQNLRICVYTLARHAQLKLLQCRFTHGQKAGLESTLEFNLLHVILGRTRCVCVIKLN